MQELAEELEEEAAGEEAAVEGEMDLEESSDESSGESVEDDGEVDVEYPAGEQPPAVAEDYKVGPRVIETRPLARNPLRSKEAIANALAALIAFLLGSGSATAAGVVAGAANAKPEADEPPAN